MIDEWWGEQGLPTALIDRVNAAVVTRLPAVLEEAEASAGAVLAVGLRDEVGPLLLPPSMWVEQGYAARPDTG
jgi:hypothetical protein